MPTVIDQLEPADQRLVGVYLPYYREGNKRNILPRAMSLYQKKSLEGARKIEGGEKVAFVATWSVSSLPADQTLCRMQFDNNGEQLNYEVRMANHEFVDFLIDIIDNYKRYKTIDFPTAFYRKLLSRD